VPLVTNLVALLTLAVAAGAWLRAGRTSARTLAFALATGGAAFAALILFERVAAVLPPATVAAAALRSAATLAALVLWAALAVLASHGTRRRDLFWILPFGLLAFLELRSSPPSTGGALVLALPVVARWRWLDAAGRRATSLTLLAALLVPILAFLPVPGDRALRGVPGAALVRYAAWARELAGLYLLFALPGLLMRWSVGIRRVSRRLALLLLLSGVVPVVLVGLLWGASTQLGVRAERALFASRLFEQTAEALHASLVVAGAEGSAAPVGASVGSPAGAGARGTGRVGPDPLQALADAHRRWRGLRLWRDGVRVHGAPVPDEQALAEWPDSLPQQGLVLLGRVPWLGARAAQSPGAAAILALVPVEDVFEAVLQPALDVKLSLLAQFTGDSLEPAIARVAEEARRGGSSKAAGDSLETLVERSAADTAGLHLTFGGGEHVLTGRTFSMTAGHGLLHGIGWSGRHWERREGMLSADVRWAAIAWGLLSTLRENPANYLPLFFIGLVVALILMIAGADFGLVRSLGRSVTGAVAALRGGASRLEAGDLSYRIPVVGQDDLWDVASAFNRMAAGLERGRQLEVERLRIEDELALARRIQARLLPPGPPQVAGLELAGTSEPAREVGGDYYDFVPLGDGRVALVIADVSGKGVGAALLMSGFRASLLSQDLARQDPARVLERLNTFLRRSVEPGKFVTAFLGVLCGRTGRLVYCNAGHNPPIVTRGDGARERLETGGLILGVMEDARYETGETMLQPGDRVTLFTDGVTEAANERDEQWGEEPLLSLLDELARGSCAETVTRIVAEVRRFEGERGASDDVTLILARRLA
jgi:serine phosphatase RsbU (regulator of sigma subunit)